MAEGWLGRVQHDGYETFSCPVKYCYYHVRLGPYTDEQHPCPSTGKTTHAWSTVMPGVIYLWEEIDKKYDEFRAMPAEDPRKNLLGAEMRGMCSALSYFMKPYYENGNAVIKEIVARGEARDKGEKRVTAGIGNVINFPSGIAKFEPGEGTFTQSMDQNTKDCEDGLHKHGTRRSTTTARTAAPVPAHNFTDEEVAKIKAFAENGFTAEDLARIHGVKVSIMRAVLGS